MRRLAQVNLGRAHRAQLQMMDAGLPAVFSGPFFNEFVLRATNLRERLAKCSAEKILPGIELARWYPELADCLLVCVTEMNEQEEIERLVRVIRN
jgi:glycine dehydrogenase subunit 1